jgi:hypothetical protein
MNLPPKPDPDPDPDPDPSLEALERLCTARPFRPLPQEWRQAILAPPTQTTASPPHPGTSFWTQLRLWLAGSSSAWAPVAATWLLIAGLNHLATPKASHPGADRPPLSPATLAMLQQERLALFRGLAESTPTHFANPNPTPRQFPPAPPTATPPRNGSGAGIREHRRHLTA